MSNAKSLAFGYSSAVPEDAKASWGARLIIDRNSHKYGGDLLPDRQGHYGLPEDFKKLSDALNRARPWKEPLAKLIAQGVVRSDKSNEVVLHDDDEIKVVGNSNASYGYFYIAGWLK